MSSTFVDMPGALQKPRLLIVEGKDEVNSFEAFRDDLGIAELEIRSFEGGDNLRGFLRALPAVAGFDALVCLGVVRDAEQNADAKTASTRSSLGAAGLSVPGGPLQLAPGKPAVAFLINPPGRATGSIEDLCLASLTGHPTMPCVEAYIECLREAGQVPTGKEGKARAHAFIASRDRPEVSLGVAIKRGYFPLKHNAFEPVRSLLNLLMSVQ